MTPLHTSHLSEEALEDVLIGLGSSQSEAHLAGCVDCRARLEAFQSDVAMFNAATMAWSENRPLRPNQNATGKAPLRPRLAFVSWAAMAVILMGMAVAIWHHGAVAPPNHATVIESQPLDSDAQIAQDNQLLQAVNAAISPDEESPIDQYKLFEAPRRHLKAHPK